MRAPRAIKLEFRQITNLFYYKGTEQFSNIYDSPVVTSVIAVRYWAFRNNNAALIALTQKYLKATWAIYGMAAGTGPVWYHDLAAQLQPDGIHTAPMRRAVCLVEPIKNDEYDQCAPRKPSGGYRYNGHFLALAGTRSLLVGHWNSDDKFTLFDRAIESVPSPLQTYENPHQRDVLDTLERNWPTLQSTTTTPPPVGENLYGLSRTLDIPKITNLINSTTSAAANASAIALMPWVTFVHTATTYRIMGWDGWRASAMDANTNGNKPNMYAIAYHGPTASERQPGTTYDPKNSRATFLFPWTDSKIGAGAGWCKLEAPLPSDPTHARIHGSAPFPREGVIYVPSSKPWFHVVFSQEAAPYLDNTTPTDWPAPTPKALAPTPFTPPGDADSGDVPWLFNYLPDGAVTNGPEYESWNWVESDPAPPFLSSYVHQSSYLPGMHQHYFTGATETLTINTGDSLYAYVYLDPSSPPSEVMLQWLDPLTGWEHRAFWGPGRIGWGAIGTSSRRYMGQLPQPLGDWVRLEVPASVLGLEGHSLTGMAYTLYDGLATWGEAGKNRSFLQMLCTGGASGGDSVSPLL